jgi:hypothetical protein
LETTVPLKNISLKLEVTYTESHETTLAELSKHENETNVCCYTSSIADAAVEMPVEKYGHILVLPRMLDEGNIPYKIHLVL